MFKKSLKYYFCLIFSLCLLNLSSLFSSLYASEVSIPDIYAEAAILMDAKSGKILYEKNAHTIYYPASITKMMTAFMVLENLKPTDTITFSTEAIHSIEYNSSNIGILVGEQLTVDQAIRGLLLDSANEVANGLAEAVSGSIDTFAINMTTRAKELGALNTNFVNPHGLHNENHYTTPYDMAYITRALYNNDYFLEIMAQPTFEIPPTNKATVSRYLSQQHGMMNERRNSVLYRNDVIAGKTGFTNEAKNTLVTVARKGDIDLIAVIMKGSQPGIYQDTNKLFDYGFNSYHTINLHNPSSTLKTLPIYSIKSGELYETAQTSISVASNQSLLISKNIKLRDITTRLNIPDYLDLGVKEKDVVGTIDYIYDSQIIASDDLIASKIQYSPAPITSFSPQPTNMISFEWFSILIILLVILLIFILFFRRKKKYKVGKKRKINFSKK
ncbi:MAG: serine hydrolase [Cellulosilyticaceae bacterium]